MGRSPCCDKTKVKKGSWSPEEDATLRDYLHRHGTGGNWIALPQKAGLKRCGKSCRLRWLNYLRPDIKHGAFTLEEEKTIFNLYNKLGSRWSVIASYLPGRTDNDVKNYWNTKLKKKLLAELSCTRTTNSTATTVVPATDFYSTSTTAAVGKTMTSLASTNSSSMVPTYSTPFLPDTSNDQRSISNGTISNDPINATTPRIVFQNDHLNHNTICPCSESLQDSGTFMPSTLEMYENYGVQGIPVEEYSYEVLSGIWFPVEAIEVDSYADITHQFPL